MTTERGSGSVLVAGVLASALVVGSSSIVVSAAILAAQRARATADLAALAGAARLTSGSSRASACRAAGTVARANGGRIESCRADLLTVRVEVSVGLPVRLSGLGASRAVGSARAGLPP